MTDRIVLQNMRFEGHHGVTAAERARAQPFEVDVELPRDLRAAGRSDDLGQTIDYAAIFDLCKAVVEGTRLRLLEAIAETIAERILTTYPVEEVVVRVRKPAVRLSGPLDHAGVEIRRRPG